MRTISVEGITQREFAAVHFDKGRGTMQAKKAQNLGLFAAP
jgi:hypothetical protein